MIRQLDIGLISSISTLLFIFLLGISAPFIVGEKALIKYQPNTLNEGAFYKAPLYKNADKPIHWLGTDGLGRDVSARLVYGAQTAMLIGFGTVIISLLISVFLGVLAGYFGNHRFKINYAQLFYLFLCAPFLLFYFF